MNEKLEPKKDDRGLLYELFKIPQVGQVFFSVSKPGVVRGNHYHTRKIERFCVVKGEGEIKIRDRASGEITTYQVNGEAPEIIDMPVGTTHNITNIGESDMYLIIWVNEVFDPNDPDTFYEEV